jgi:hypothetical protein
MASFDWPGSKAGPTDIVQSLFGKGSTNCILASEVRNIAATMMIAVAHVILQKWRTVVTFSIS